MNEQMTPIITGPRNGEQATASPHDHFPLTLHDRWGPPSMSHASWVSMGDIVNCESVPGQMGSLYVFSYSPHSMRAIHDVPWFVAGQQVTSLIIRMLAEMCELLERILAVVLVAK